MSSPNRAGDGAPVYITGNIIGGRGGDGGPNGNGAPGGSVNVSGGAGGNYYEAAPRGAGRDKFFESVIANIQATSEAPEVKAEALAMVEKAKTEPTWDVAVRRVKSALSLVKDGAVLLAMFIKEGWIDGPNPGP